MSNGPAASSPPAIASVTVVVTSSFDILASSLTASSSETQESPIDTSPITTIDTPTSDASAVIVKPSEDAPSTEDYPWWTLFNLGTITTIGRPTLVLPTSSLSRGSPVISSPPVVSSSSPTNDETSFPTLTSSFNYNGTSRSWSWNTTSSAPSLISPTVTSSQPTTVSTTSTITATPSECPAQESGPITITSYSIIHTSTTTWTGDPDDYTPPYPPISTPLPCTPHQSPTGRFTVTFCDSTGKTCTLIHTSVPPGTVTPTDPAEPTSTVIFTTTDKNPVVVFPTQAPPDYGGTPSGPDVHDTAIKGSTSRVITPDYGMDPTPIESAKTSPTPTPGGGNNERPPPVTVIVQPSKVIIDDRTFTDSPSQPTSTVVVGDETFVINPSQVVGGGTTMTRLPIDIGGGFAPPPLPLPITTSVGGLEVVLGPSSVAIIDGTVFTIAPTSTVAVIEGQTVTLGPEGLIFPSQTLHIAAGPGSGPTQTAVMGGQLITAIGSDTVVISGSTITYGSSAFDASSTLTTVVDGDTVLVAATGVVLHEGRETLGGITAAPDATKYEIVGGATITQLGLTAVEISGRTFRIGPGAAATPVTTVIAGHTLTIGPDGVGMSTWTLGAPYASTTTIFPGGAGGGGGHYNSGNGNNAAMTIPTATGTAGEDDSAGTALQQPGRLHVLLFSLGVGCLGPLLFWL
ncbi:hypothetical protein Daesc_000473 [Daldinia eschscholtzii]|uniref:Uncharacterized protein n=1 Tax=Daldinia eschscholtzii TaxID=292717 RepID=A0AAX6MYT7_9PEZI